MKVYIVAGMELGWDNIVAVFPGDKYTKEEIEKTFPPSQRYVVFDKEVYEGPLENWLD